MFNNVVVGVSNPKSGEDAIALAKRLLSADGRLTLANIYVFPTEPHLSNGYTRDIETLERARAAELLQRARTQAGIPARARWRGASSVGRGLHELAEAADADLLVVGMSRQGLVGRTMLGDNTRATLGGAPCAVAAAPAGYAQRAREITRVRVLGEPSPEDLAADSATADLLVLGSRGRGPFGRLLDRRTYRSLERNTQCPLLVLPRGEDALVAAEALAYGESTASVELR
jgi:nucleotide-binding universal stress UspA family protein